LGDKVVHKGMNATACSFYSSQGRVTNQFGDHNETLIDKFLLAEYPKVKSLEMETFHLFDLAECSKGKIIAASMCLILAQRKSGIFIDLELKTERELMLGKIGLEAISKVKI
jgi:uridine phosphorylase